MAEQESTNLFGEKILLDDGTRIELFDTESILESALQDFRRLGFPYPELNIFECKMMLNILANQKQSECVRSNVGYRIADTYNKHRFHSAAINMCSPFDSFNDDKKLRKVLKMQYETNKSFEYGYLGFMSLVNGTQACSNFRPAFARMLYNKYAPKNGIVFDSSTGFGGRLVGFIASHCKEYHGTDPNTLTHAANVRMSEDLGAGKQIHLYNSPIEDLNVEHLVEHCDFSFTSPPYFKKEIYSAEETQSCHRYPAYESWLTGFLRPMIQKQYIVLKDKSLCIINIEDVKIKGELNKLVEPTIEIALQEGFEWIENDVFPMQARTRMVNGEKFIEQGKETVIVLRKIKK